MENSGKETNVKFARAFLFSVPYMIESNFYHISNLEKVHFDYIENLHLSS